jgi:hypothetical protein
MPKGCRSQRSQFTRRLTRDRLHGGYPIIFRPAVFDREILTLDISDGFQAVVEGREKRSIGAGSHAADEPQLPLRRLLRARCERPRRRAKPSDEFFAHLRLPCRGLSRQNSTAKPAVPGPGACPGLDPTGKGAGLVCPGRPPRSPVGGPLTRYFGSSLPSYPRRSEAFLGLLNDREH